MPVQIACVVEGYGDVEAVPIVVRRIAERFDPGISVHIPLPIRIPKSKLLKPTELERAVDLAIRKIGGNGAVLVVLDSDDDCPRDVAPHLLQRITHEFGHMPIPLAVVLAKREFESWFLAAAGSLRGNRGLLQELEPPPDPEEIRDAKGWLSSQMEEGHRYVGTLDQPAFASLFDLGLARQADSFDKFYRDIERILAAIRGVEQH